MAVNFGDEYARQEAVREELLRDEIVQWSGQPDPSVIFTKSDIFMIPFSLVWGGFAIFWELAASGVLFGSSGHGSPPIFFPLFGLPFVLVGLYFMFGRFFYRSWINKRTCYVVTNKRVINISLGIKGRNVQATFIRDIPTINKSIGGNGVGTLVFGNSRGMMGYYGNTGMEWMGSNSVVGAVPQSFYDIRDANAVYELLNRLRNEPEAKGY